jgi:hypothetical protein
MTSKKINKANRQIGDQTTKGGLLGIACYAMWKAHCRPCTNLNADASYVECVGVLVNENR